MREFSTDSAGFAALTLVEILIQELVQKGVLEGKDAKRVLKASRKRHKKAAQRNADNAVLNHEAADLIQIMKFELSSLLE